MTLELTLSPAFPVAPTFGKRPGDLLALASLRRSGFPEVLCHDSVLDAPRCGGPVVDSSGRFVGINIARADKGATYALPVPVIEAACKRLLANPESY